MESLKFHKISVIVVLDINKKVLAISVARSTQSFGVSFIIILLPVFISGSEVTTGYLGLSVFGFNITKEFLIGIAISTTALISSLGQPIGGRLTDIYKKRRIFILISLTVLSLTYPFYLIVDSYNQIIVLRAIQGISAAFLIPSVSALINDISDKSDRGENFGIYNTLRLIGFGIGPIIAGYIVDNGPYNTSVYQFSGVEFCFIVTIVFTVLSLLIVIIFVNESNIKNEESNSSRGIKKILQSNNIKPVIVLGLSTLLLASSIAIFLTLEESINNRLNQTTLMFSIQFSAAVLANTVSQTPIGRFSDKYGRKNLILVGFLILIPTITIQGFIYSSTIMVIVRLIQGVSVALVFAPSLALTGDISNKSESGTYLSIVTASFGLGIAVGPTVSGFLYSIGSLSTPFVFSGIISIIGFLLVYIYVPDL